MQAAGRRTTQRCEVRTSAVLLLLTVLLIEPPPCLCYSMVLSVCLLIRTSFAPAGWLRGKQHPITGAPLEIEELEVGPGSMVAVLCHGAHAVSPKTTPGTRWGTIFGFRVPVRHATHSYYLVYVLDNLSSHKNSAHVLVLD
jgi:hypothetical protein